MGVRVIAAVMAVGALVGVVGVAHVGVSAEGPVVTTSAGDWPIPCRGGYPGVCPY
jgi:hypothetical protein